MSDIVIGIDLGTTYSCAAVYHRDRQVAEVLLNRHGQSLTPSVVWFGAGRVEVGQTAKDRQLARDQDVMSLGKREMGNPLYQPAFGGMPRTSEEFSAKVLEAVAADAGKALGLGGPVRKAVITVPAYFWEPQWAATLNAAKAAGLQVPLIINEPEAAALAFVATGTIRGNMPAAGTYLVYDLGGGTFDVAVVRVTPGSRWRVEALAYDGDSYLGGREFDAVITRHVRASAKRLGAELLDPGAEAEWAVRAEQTKIQLSSADSVDIPFTAGSVSGTVTLTRREFEQGCETLVQRTLDASKRALDDAKLSWSQLAGVLLVGGSTRMPMISAALTKLTGRSPRTDLHPDEAVALGAAIAAAGIDGDGPPVDFTPVSAHALGVILRSADGTRWVNVPVLPRNSPIGNRGSRTFKASLRPDGSGVLNIYITQGDVSNPTDPRCRILYQFKATGLPAGVGTVSVETTYEYTVDRMIRVTARVADGGPELLVTPERLTDTERFHSPPPPPDPVSVVLALDASGSMSLEKRFDTVRLAASQCLTALAVPGSRVGVLLYDQDAREVCPLTADSEKLRLALASALPTTYGTRFLPPLQKAREILQSRSGKRVVVLLTDGEPMGEDASSKQDAEKAFAEANHCRSSGIEVRTVGTGEATLDFLNKIGPGVIAEAANLERAFLAVMSDIGTDDRADDTGGGGSPVDGGSTSKSQVPVANLFLAIGCSLETSASDLPRLLDEANSRWSNRFTDGDGLYYRALSARYGYFRRIIDDPHALAREREEARQASTAAEATKRLRVDELLKAAARKDGCVTESEVADFARETGVPLVEVRAIADAHGISVVPDEKEPHFPELAPAQAQDLADHLRDVSYPNLYAVVDGTPETPSKELLRQAQEMYDQAGGESGTDRLRTKLLADAVRIFADPDLLVRYENTRLLNQLDRFRKEIELMAGTNKVLEVEDQEALLGQMAAAAKPVAYRGANELVGKVILMRTATEHGIRLLKDGKEHILTPKVRCLECGHLNPDGAVRCEVCDHDLYPKCPQCDEKNLNGTAQCRKCQLELLRKPEADALAHEALQTLEFGDDPTKADKLAEDALKLWPGHPVAENVRRRVREGRNSTTAAFEQARTHQDARRHRAALDELKKVPAGSERHALEEISRNAVAEATARIDQGDAIRDRDPDGAFDLYHEANGLCADSGADDRIATCPPAAVGEVRGQILRGTLQLTWVPSPSATRDAQIEYRVELVALDPKTGAEINKKPIVAKTRDTRTGTPVVGGVPVLADVTALRRGTPGMPVRGGPFLFAPVVENARAKPDAKGHVRLSYKAPTLDGRVVVTRKSSGGESKIDASSTSAIDRNPPAGEMLTYRVVASYQLPGGNSVESEPTEVMIMVPGKAPSSSTLTSTSPLPRPRIDVAVPDAPTPPNMVPPVAHDVITPITDLTVEVTTDPHGAYEIIARFAAPEEGSPEVYASESLPPARQGETVPIGELTRFGEAMAIISASEARLNWSTPTLFVTPVTVNGTVAVVGQSSIVVPPQACHLFVTKPGVEIRIEAPWPTGVNGATARVINNPKGASSKSTEVQLTREKTIGWAVHSFPMMTPSAHVIPLATVSVGSDRFENASPSSYHIPLAERRTLYVRLVLEREHNWLPWGRWTHRLLRRPNGRILRVRVWIVPDRMTDRMPSLELRYYPSGRPLDSEEGVKVKDLYRAPTKGTESFGPDRPFTDVLDLDGPLDPETGFRIFATNLDEAIGWRFIDTSNCF